MPLLHGEHMEIQMSNQSIEVIEMVAVSPAQAKAIRKLALRNSKHNAEQFAQLVFDRAVKNNFAPLVKSIAEDAAKKYDQAVAGGFEPPCTRQEYVTRAAIEYKDILSELEG